MPANDWKYYVTRSKDGEAMGELPLGDVSIEDVLSGTSTLSGTMHIHDQGGVRGLTAPWKMEVTAVRGSEIGFHGPIVARVPRIGENMLDIAAASPHAYFIKRVTEVPRQYKRDQFGIVRSLIEDARAKAGGQLYNMVIHPGDSGVVKAFSVGGTERKRVADCIEELSQDAHTGFDFRWTYTWGNEAQRYVRRALNLGYPTIGVDKSASVVIELNENLVNVTDSEDGLTHANRVHVLGSGQGTKRLRAVSQSTPSLDAGYPLLEEVFDRSDVKDQTRLNGIAAALRNVVLPGGRRFTSEHTINDANPYGRVDLGDRIRLRVASGVEFINVTRRVVAITTVPGEDKVRYQYYDPADDA